MEMARREMVPMLVSVGFGLLRVIILLGWNFFTLTQGQQWNQDLELTATVGRSRLRICGSGSNQRAFVWDNKILTTWS